VIAGAFLVAWSLTGTPAASANPPAPTSASDSAGLDCKPHAPRLPTPWRLHDLRPDLLQFYEAIARTNGMTLDMLLGGLSDSFRARSYDFEEVQGNFASLRSLITTRTPVWNSVMPSASEPRSNATSADFLILYLDPTCEVCTRKLLLSHRLEQECPSESPSLVLRALPTDSELAMDSAVMLKKIAADAPGEFIAAFLETSTVLAQNAGLLPEVASHYLGSPALRGMPWYGELRNGVEQDRRRTRLVFPDRDFPTPFVLFRGRTLQRHGADAFPFDPLHDSDVLLRTLQLIVQFDAIRSSPPGR
jgi:hypothetical protein